MRTVPGWVLAFVAMGPLSGLAHAGEAPAVASTSRLAKVPRLKNPIPKPAAANFQCDGASCTCHGDRDCNDMFGTNVCGPHALCDTTSGVTCTCLRKSR